MPTQSKHASINISLIQAREALMTQFRPILNQANITDQQWADYPSFGGKRHAGLSRFGESGVYSAPQPDRYPDPP